MEKLTSLFALFAMIFSFIFSSSPARADLPPAAWHCLSKDECVVALVNTGIEVRRKGQVLETIPDMAPSAIAKGWITALNGYIVTTFENSSLAYTYNVETGERCLVNTGLACFETIVVKPPLQTWDSVYMACQDSLFGSIRLDTCEFAVSTNSTTYASSITRGRERIFVGDFFGGRIESITYLNPTSSNIETNQPRTLQVRYWTDPNSTVDINDYLYFHDLNKIFKVGVTQTAFQEILFLDTDAFFIDTYILHMSVNATHLLVSEWRNTSLLVDLANPASPVSITLSNPKGAVLTPATAYITHSGGIPGTKAYDLQGNEIPEWNTGGALNIAYMAPIYSPVCGNNLQEDDPLTPTIEESCDGSDFDDKTCLTEGFDEGELACNQDCSLDTSGCSYVCGNGIAAPTEACDEEDLKGENCVSQGFVSGTLSCSASCELDNTLCESCGNNVIDAEFNEVCDGAALGGIICQTLPGENFTGGILACLASCDNYDTSGCYFCGDGNVNGAEECDGNNLNAQTCESLGYSGGTLACFQNCTFNISGCEGVPEAICGNGVVDALEECDDGNRTNGDGCDENCRIESATCGNEIADDVLEECDGDDLKNASCASLGFDHGTLFCEKNCRYNKSECRWESGPQDTSVIPNSLPTSGDLDGPALNKYQSSVAGSQPNCVVDASEGGVSFSIPPGDYYCNITSLNLVTKHQIFHHLYNPDSPIGNTQPVVLYATNGEIYEDNGGHVKACKGLNASLHIGSIGGDYEIQRTSQSYQTNDINEFLSVHPARQIPGRWLEVKVPQGSQKLCPYDFVEGCVLLTAGATDTIIINLDDISNLNKVDRKNKSGCNTSGDTSLPFLVFPLIIFLFAIRRHTV